MHISTPGDSILADKSCYLSKERAFSPRIPNKHLATLLAPNQPTHVAG